MAHRVAFVEGEGPVVRLLCAGLDCNHLVIRGMQLLVVGWVYQVVVVLVACTFFWHLAAIGTITKSCSLLVF